MCHGLSVVFHHDVGLCSGISREHFQGYLCVVDVGNHLISRDMCLVHGLQPHRLPDATRCRIPYTFGIYTLFAVGLSAKVGRVVHGYHHLLLGSGGKKRGYVYRKWVVTTTVSAGFLAVYVDFTLPVDGSEVHEHVPIAIALRQWKRASVHHGASCVGFKVDRKSTRLNSSHAISRMPSSA